MTAYDATGLERTPTGDRLTVTARPYRSPRHEGHGPRCRSNPEIGCVCGEAERQSLRSERTIGGDTDRRRHARAIAARPDCPGCVAGKGIIVAGIAHSTANPSHGHCACRACELRMRAA